jgi:dihydroorotate dehydrogenase (fumarate)
MVSAILRHGADYFKKMLEGLDRWMGWNRFAALDDFRGRLSLRPTDDPDAFERAHYIRALQSWKA